jgi:predicted  nucleic acid-binding Zn-ribbon protein
MGHEMNGGGDDGPLNADFWAKVRQRYEAGAETVAAISADAGITAHTLTKRARAEGWALRNAPKKKTLGTRETIARLKALLQRRLAEFEGQIDQLTEQVTAATSERDIRAMNTLVRTLEKVLELERKERTQRKRNARRHFDDAEREALADKLEGLSRELQQARAAVDAEATGIAGNGAAEPRLAELGAGGAATSA